MRILGTVAVAALASSSTLAAASADYYLQIKAVGRDTPAGPIYLDAVSTGDLDGDGLADEVIIRLACAGGEVRSAEYNVKGPRDAGSGMASGKRTHHPVTFVKEWGASTPQLRAMKVTYDLKKGEVARAKPMAEDSWHTGAKTMAEDSWHHVSLVKTGGLCPAVEEAVGKISKSRSNIQNN